MIISSEFTERFFARVAKADTPDGCWLWQGAIQGNGYGNVRLNGPVQAAHRVSYWIANGPIPEGLQLDHLCRVRHCVNPEHLEAVSQRENVIRGVAPSAANALKTHCLRGHEFTPENTYLRRSDGGRVCIQCRRAADRVRDAGRRKRSAGRSEGKAA